MPDPSDYTLFVAIPGKNIASKEGGIRILFFRFTKSEQEL